MEWQKNDEPYFIFPDLLTEVSLVAHLANLVDLSFQPIDVSHFVFQQTLEQLTRCIVTLVTTDLNYSVTDQTVHDFCAQVPRSANDTQGAT